MYEARYLYAGVDMMHRVVRGKRIRFCYEAAKRPRRSTRDNYDRKVVTEERLKVYRQPRFEPVFPDFDHTHLMVLIGNRV